MRSAFLQVSKHETDTFVDLLKDESSEVDLVGPTLPALKSLLSLPYALPQDKETFGQLVHALLSACLHHIDEMRYSTLCQGPAGSRSERFPSTRAGAIATKKVKNNLLAAVLVLTVIPSDVKLGREAVEHCCFLISQRLYADDEVFYHSPSMPWCRSFILYPSGVTHSSTLL